MDSAPFCPREHTDELPFRCPELVKLDNEIARLNFEIYRDEAIESREIILNYIARLGTAEAEIRRLKKMLKIN